MHDGGAGAVFVGVGFDEVFDNDRGHKKASAEVVRFQPVLGEHGEGQIPRYSKAARRVANLKQGRSQRF